MLPVIANGVYYKNDNSDAAKKFAEWAHTAPFEMAIEAYADCHSDPNIDDSFIRTLAQCDRYYLGVFICNRHDMLHPWIYERCREVEANKDSFITSGLWSKSRHPNYFAEWMVWNGLIIASIPSYFALFNAEAYWIWILIGIALYFFSIKLHIGYL